MNKLPKAPLQEAIFEIRWQLQPDADGRQLMDSEYAFALGKFQDAVKDDFPHHVAKFPQDIPHQLLNYQTMHQFWRKDKQWPVVQLGPGIATVNAAEESYNWEETYRQYIKQTLSALEKSYGQLIFNSLTLRYIDVVRVEDYEFNGWEDFIQKQMNFRFENLFNTRGKLTGFNFEQSFDLNELGFLNVSFTNGENNKKEDIFIWQTAVVKQGNIPRDAVELWLNRAHECTSDLFKEICKKGFYDSFSK